MSKPPKKAAYFPSRQEVIDFIRSCEHPPGKNEIARAFHIRGEDKDKLRLLLQDVEGTAPRRREKENSKKHAKKEKPAMRLQQVSVLEITSVNNDGEAVASPVDWDAKKSPPHIVVSQQDRTVAAPVVGARILAKLTATSSNAYSAQIIRVLPEQPKGRVIGIYRLSKGQGSIEPISRKQKITYSVKTADSLNAQVGDLVVGKMTSQPRRGHYGSPEAVIVEVLGHINAPRAASLIAIHHHEIPNEFPEAAISQAESSTPPFPENRKDLRTIPLVTIDGEDARDFDDAVYAEMDKKNPGGWHLIVAIADVAHYVRPDDALDAEAFLRGNSVYFPDRVVPMLPEALSTGLCSLKPDEDRYCLAVHLWVDKDGNTIRHEFVRGIMRSHARLTYEQAQAIHDGREDHPLSAQVNALYGVYDALNKNRIERGTLDLDIPEYKIILNEEGVVAEICKRQRLDSHKLIEECMIAANVAAALLIENAGHAAMFRAHEPPDPLKIMDLRTFLEEAGYSLSKGDGLKPVHFNKVLEASKDSGEAHLVHTAILRSQTQAYYNPRNVGHFGLALTHYCHFTSPIRRYSDLIVHRAIISILAFHGWREDGITDALTERLAEIGEHISMTERRAMMAEREANDRYLALYMADKVGGEFHGHIAGVNSFGLFVALDDTGAQGFIPVSSLRDDFYYYDQRSSSLNGRRTRNVLQLSQRVRVKLRDAVTATGSLLFELLWAESKERKNTGASTIRPFKERKALGKKDASKKKKNEKRKKRR